jgi:MFS family permease
VIAGSVSVGAVGALTYVLAGGPWLLVLGTPIFGVAIGIATTAAYTAASRVMPSTARGAGFGLLTTASLTGLALSPIVSGILGATSIRAVFVLDVIALVVLAVFVSRLMITARLPETTSPATEEI